MYFIATFLEEVLKYLVSGEIIHNKIMLEEISILVYHG